MGLQTTESVSIAAPPGKVFPFVVSLEEYPSWLPLVHQAVPAAYADDRPAWSVELRAQVGPFARSKRLRMIRVRQDRDRVVEFERAEIDGREHARWSLRVELEADVDMPERDAPRRGTAEGGTATLVTMHLAYDGGLWTGGLLDRVLESEIRKGRAGLAALVSAAPTH